MYSPRSTRRATDQMHDQRSSTPRPSRVQVFISLVRQYDRPLHRLRKGEHWRLIMRSKSVEREEGKNEQRADPKDELNIFKAERGASCGSLCKRRWILFL